MKTEKLMNKAAETEQTVTGNERKETSAETPSKGPGREDSVKRSNKISVIGAGFVGSATTLALVESGVASEIVLVDRILAKAQGEVMDISHGAAFYQAVNLRAGTYEDTNHSDLVILTAGASQKPGETRLDLVHKNIAIYKDLIPQVVQYSPDAVLLIVANPVDILAYAAWKLSGFPAERVIGSGTVLDSSRLRSVLARAFDLDARSIHARIAGEHGDSEFALWSSADIGSVRIEDYARREGIDLPALKASVIEEVRSSAYQIIEKKGYTNYAIALAVRRIAEAILRNEHTILSISTLDEEADVYYSVPNVIGRGGKVKRMLPELSADEKEQLNHSITVLKHIIDQSEIR